MGEGEGRKEREGEGRKEREGEGRKERERESVRKDFCTVDFCRLRA